MRLVRFAGDELLDYCERVEDALGQSVFARRQLERGANVERQVTDPLRPTEQRLDRGQRPDARAGRQPQVLQLVGEGLDVGGRDRAQRLGDKQQEALGLAAVGILGGGRS